MSETVQNQIESLENILDWISDNMDEESFEDLSQVREDVESALLILEGGVPLPDATSESQSMELIVSEEDIPLYTQPRLTQEMNRPQVRDPIPYPTDPRHFTPESKSRAIRQRTTNVRTPSTPTGPSHLPRTDVNRINGEIWHLVSGQHPSFTPKSARDLLRFNYRFISNDIPVREMTRPNATKYYAVLRHAEDSAKMYAPLIYCSDGNENDCHYVPLWKDEDGNTVVGQHEPYSKSGTLSEMKGHAKRLIRQKTGQSQRSGKYYMTKGSMSAVHNLGMSTRSKHTRNSQWRALTGINDGIFVFRSPERPPKTYCPIKRDDDE